MKFMRPFAKPNVFSFLVFPINEAIQYTVAIQRLTTELTMIVLVLLYNNSLYQCEDSVQHNVKIRYIRF